MMRFEMNTNDKKQLIARVSELTGKPANYTKVPRCAYEIGLFTVEKDGALTIEEENIDRDILETLMEEGLIVRADLGGEEEDEPLALKVAFPAAHHTGTSLRNLINLLYSRGPLINKAIGSHFEVDEGLVESLKNEDCIVSTLEFRKAVAAYEDEHGLSISGLTITPEKVVFEGFAEGMDADHMKVCTELTALMNKMALTQKRIQPKRTTAENEKYAFRIWLLRLGMGGSEYKEARKILLENLDGNSAFRTEEDAEKFKAKEKQKRDALKAAKAAAAAEQENTEGQDAETEVAENE
ncbi:MAG: hypothetical protein LUG99_09130 [Lachnospiraceae bacterium]|nr:hypothetical protein [Lachnospiraceae bacterium]